MLRKAVVRPLLAVVVALLLLAVGPTLDARGGGHGGVGGGPSVTWTPTQKVVEVPPGGVADVTAEFESRGAFASLAVRVVPELRPVVTVTPEDLGAIDAGSPNTVELTVEVPEDEEPGSTYDGTIQLRDGDRGIARPLPVRVVVSEEQPPAEPRCDGIVAEQLAPNEGTFGTITTISGSGFGDDPDAVTVTFEGEQQGAHDVAPFAITDDTVAVIVPLAVPEPLSVAVTVGDCRLDGFAFSLQELTDPTPDDPGAEVEAFVESAGRVLEGIGSKLAGLDQVLADLDNVEVAEGGPEDGLLHDGDLEAVLDLLDQMAEVLEHVSLIEAPEALVAQLADQGHEVSVDDLLRTMDAFHSTPIFQQVLAELEGAEALLASNSPAGQVVDTLVGVEQTLIDIIEVLRAIQGALEILETVADLVAPEHSFDTMLWQLDVVITALEAVVYILDIAPTSAVEDSLEVEQIDAVGFNSWIGFESEVWVEPGVALSAHPPRYRAHVDFSNDGATGFREFLVDLIGAVFGSDAANILDGFRELLTEAEELAGIQVFEIRLGEIAIPSRIDSDDPTIVPSDPGAPDEGRDEPVLQPAGVGTLEVAITAALREVAASCEDVDTSLAVDRPCVPAEDLRLSRTFDTLDSPSLDAIEPVEAFIGSDIMIQGRGFHAPGDLHEVLSPRPNPRTEVHFPGATDFDDDLGGTTSPDEAGFDRLDLRVPDTLSGEVTVSVAPDGDEPTHSAPVPFEVRDPRIDTVAGHGPDQPMTFLAGEPVEIRGRGFASLGEHHDVLWGETSGPVHTVGTDNERLLTTATGEGAMHLQVLALGELATNEVPVSVRDFGDTVDLSEPDRDAVRPEMARAPGGDLGVAWVERQEAGGQRILFTRLPDGEDGFLPPTSIAAPVDGPVPPAPPQLALAIDDDRVVVGWSTSDGDEVGVRLSTSTDGGASFSTTTVSASTTIDQSPAVAVRGDEVAVAWTSHAGDGSDPVVLVRTSGDGGQSFGATEQLGEAAATDAALAYGEDGLLYAGWTEVTGRAPAFEHDLPVRDVHLASSDGDGFGAAVNVSQYPQQRVGDTAPIAREPDLAPTPAACGGGVHVAWTGTLLEEAPGAGVHPGEGVSVSRWQPGDDPLDPVDVLYPDDGGSAFERAQTTRAQIAVNDGCTTAVAWAQHDHPVDPLQSGSLSDRSDVRFVRSVDPQLQTWLREPDSVGRNLSATEAASREPQLAVGEGPHMATVWQERVGDRWVVRYRAVEPSAPDAPPAPSSEDLDTPGVPQALLTHRLQEPDAGDTRDSWLSDPDGAGARQLTFHGATTSAPAPSPDGEHVAFTTDLSVWLADADGHRPLRVYTSDFQLGYQQPVWSPDGSTLVVWQSGEGVGPRLLALNIAESETRTVPTNFPGPGPQSWERDGERLVLSYGGFVGNPTELVIWSPLDGTFDGGVETLRDEVDVDISSPAWSPAGGWIAYTETSEFQGPDHLRVITIDGEGDTPVFDPDQLADGGLDLSHPGWSPDGQLLTYEVCNGSSCDVAAVAVQAAGSALTVDDPVILAEGSDDQRREPRWSDDGQALLYYVDGGDVHALDLTDGLQDAPSPERITDWDGVVSEPRRR